MSRPPAPAPTSCWRRAPTTPSGASGSASTESTRPGHGGGDVVAGADTAEAEPRELGDPGREPVSIDPFAAAQRAAARRFRDSDERVGEHQAVLGGHGNLDQRRDDG